MMERKYFKSIEETMLVDRLDNGLRVVLVPKTDYNQVYGMFATNFGSDQDKIRDLKTQETFRIPSGAAHFLEHKLFEGENGEDALTEFMHQGAEANAFTSQNLTGYVFNASFDIDQNITALLDFVQTPSFTPEGVEKEKGIIIQEILMYEDIPMSRLHQESLLSLYPNHAVGLDIAGTVESVRNTQYEDLMLAYDAFYHPSQMTLVVIGNFDVDSILTTIHENQASKSFGAKQYENIDTKLSEAAVEDKKLTMDVSQPMVGLSLRMDPIKETGNDLLKTSLVSEIFLELLVGSTSHNQQDWYDSELIDSNFVYIMSNESPMHHIFLATSTENEEQLVTVWKDTLQGWASQTDINEDHFQQIVKSMTGDLLTSLNSLDNLAYDIAESVFLSYDYFEILTVLQSLTLKDVIDYGNQYIPNSKWSKVTIFPKE